MIFTNIFYVTQYIQEVIISMCNPYKISNKVVFTFFFSYTVFEIQPIFIQMLFSLEILDLHLSCIKFTTEEVDLHTQVVPNILKSFPTTKSKRISVFKFKLDKMKSKGNIQFPGCPRHISSAPESHVCWCQTTPAPAWEILPLSPRPTSAIGQGSILSYLPCAHPQPWFPQTVSWSQAPIPAATPLAPGLGSDPQTKGCKRRAGPQPPAGWGWTDRRTGQQQGQSRQPGEPRSQAAPPAPPPAKASPAGVKPIRRACDKRV